ncbi:CidA/LrgA family protein [Brevibacillus humidisoli]|uniref:CidA/LrgA family protein n=1 Tax=Brevibacillus humidisoli TaxID=2895522 RepID=UPI001E4A2CBB|nr:CidA/LrgA family protein [Brevibacillus humidisoli]UFJ42228.1 CidA/LrgA family protein [Brevibacillus humidisoli]
MKLLVEILLLSVLYGAAVLLHKVITLPFPPVLTGMVLMLFLLWTGAVKPERWELSSRFFTRHMMLFLVPLVVGMMNYWPELSQGGWRLLVIIVLSTAIVLICTAWAAMMLKRGERRNDEQ